MGNERKSRHARMGMFIDERNLKRMSDLQTRKMPIPGQDTRIAHGRETVRYRTMDRASNQKVTFDVAVIYDNEENLWVAECDLLGIVTEAKTFELLTQRVQDLVPDMIVANQIILAGRKPYLNFNHLEEAVI